MPVYNGAKYIRRSIESALNQTSDDFELICIDDESQDESLSILREIEQQNQRLKVFTKKNGGCAPKSLNYVLPYIRGEYVFYMSQDDLLGEDLIEKLIKRIDETHADAILPDMCWLYDYDQKENLTGIFPPDHNYDTILTGKEALIASLDWSIHGFALWSKSLIRDGWYDFNFCADEYSTRVFFLRSEKVAFCDGKFYYYQGNAGAITKKITKSTFDTLETNNRIEELVTENFSDEKSLLKMKKLKWVVVFLNQLGLVRYRKISSDKKELQEIQQRLKTEYYHLDRDTLKKEYLKELPFSRRFPTSLMLNSFAMFRAISKMYVILKK
jgi:glycosyltransferase involved in cell wall biosynthesis